MTLRRITASTSGAFSPTATNLASEAIRLPAGRSALNRQTAGPTALIVAEGEIAIGTLDENATLSAGEGVLLEARLPVLAHRGVGFAGVAVLSVGKAL